MNTHIPKATMARRPNMSLNLAEMIKKPGFYFSTHPSPFSFSFLNVVARTGISQQIRVNNPTTPLKPPKPTRNPHQRRAHNSGIQQRQEQTQTKATTAALAHFRILQKSGSRTQASGSEA